MKRLFIGYLLAIIWLLPTVCQACTVCRPKVQAAIHTPEYSANVALLLLPVVVLLLLGLGLYYIGPVLARRITAGFFFSRS